MLMSLKAPLRIALARRRIPSLDLSQTSISDRALRYISKLTRLESLDLSDTGITDDALPYLLQLKRLKTLSVSRTSMSTKAVNTIKSQFKGTTVFFFTE